MHDVKRMHEKAKDLTDGRRHIKNSGSCINSQDGDMLFERDNINKRWAEYISDLYSDASRPESTPMENLQGPVILNEEVEKAVKNLKNGKAPGCDGIRAEELKALDSTEMKMLTSLYNEMFRSGELPKDLKHSHFITIPKKIRRTTLLIVLTIAQSA